MIRFNIYIGNKRIFFNSLVETLESRPVYQPELSTYLFYGKGKLQQIDFNLSNKFIKKEAYITSLNSLTDDLLNTYITNFEDGLMNFILYRNVKSFYFLKKIGYYYIRNKKSITGKKFDFKNLKFIFINLKIHFEYSKNNQYEKKMAEALLERLFIGRRLKNFFKFLNKDYQFYKDIIDIYINCKFIKNKNKIYLKNIKYIIEKNEKNVIK